MSTETVATKSPETAQVETLPLSRVIADVAADSQESPQEYLDEVVVPRGGE